MSEENIEHLDATEWGDADHSLVTDDPWHEHSGEEPPQDAHGETSPGVIAIGGIVSFFIVVACVLFVTMYFDRVLLWKYEEVVEVDLGEGFRNQQEAWMGNLNGYGWEDPQNNTIRIPIDLAIDRVAAEYTE
jgi:hypothetical protein